MKSLNRNKIKNEPPKIKSSQCLHDCAKTVLSHITNSICVHRYLLLNIAINIFTNFCRVYLGGAGLLMTRYIYKL